jgi:hypothetical protein
MSLLNRFRQDAILNTGAIPRSADQVLDSRRQMSPHELYEALKRQPFTPVRLHMCNGHTHDVKHRDDAIISDEVVAIGVYENDAERPRIRLLSLININNVELLPANRS